MTSDEIMFNMFVAFLIACIAAIYISIGALFHWVLAGDVLSFYSAATWGLLLGWPAIVVLMVLLWEVVCHIVEFLIVAATACVSKWTR